MLTDPAPAVRLIGFGENGMELELRIWIMDPQASAVNVRSDVNRAIGRLFKQHGITITYPQRDLRVLSVPEEAKSRMASSRTMDTKHPVEG